MRISWWELKDQLKIIIVGETNHLKDLWPLESLNTADLYRNPSPI